MGKPGMMFYFGDFHIISSLTDAELGSLIRAAIEYAEYGTVPSFDSNLLISWQLLRAAVDRDSAAYELKCRKGEYAAYCKQQKKLGLPEVPFAEWMNGCIRTITDDNGCIRTITDVNQALPNQPLPNPNPNPIPVPIPNPNTSFKKERVRKEKTLRYWIDKFGELSTDDMKEFDYCYKTVGADRLMQMIDEAAARGVRENTAALGYIGLLATRIELQEEDNETT